MLLFMLYLKYIKFSESSWWWCCSVTQLCLTLWDPMDWTHQAPLFMRFPRLPFPPPGDLPNPGIEIVSPALAGIFFTTAPPRKPPFSVYCCVISSLPFWAHAVAFWGPTIGFYMYWLYFVLLCYLNLLDGEGNSNLLQYSCLENSMDKGACGVLVYEDARSRTRLSN